MTAVDVSLVTPGHDVADARLHRLCGALVRAGLRVEVLGLGDPADGPEHCRVEAVRRPGLLGRAALGARLAARARGQVLLAVDPDGLLAARVVGAVRGRRVVADVHEDYASLLRDRAWAVGVVGRVGALVAALASRAAAGADLTLVADEHVPPGTARRRLVVRNEADPSLLGAPTEPDPSPRAVYIGDVRRSRGLFAMLDVLADATDWSLDVVGPVASADRAELDARLAAEPDLAARVRWHGRLPPARAWSVARGAWVGLALLADTPAFRDAVPSKVYEYLDLGIVPVVSDLPRQRDLVGRRGGVVAPGVADAVAALRDLADPGVHARVRREILAHPERVPGGHTAYDTAAAAIAELAR